MKKIFLFFVFVLLAAGTARAVPTQYGATGLISQPTAETLNAGNICVGVWCNYSYVDQTEKEALILPVGITIGLGTFFEMYGSYPNLLFNDDELESGRGATNLGAKIRFLGKRSSRFKMALEGQALRTISDNPDIDGLTDYMGRVIASLKLDTIGFHVNGGYVSTESPKGINYDDQVLGGGGIEFFPTGRLRIIAEGEWRSSKLVNGDDYTEVSTGFQYYVSPHFTFNLAGSLGLEDGAPDWRVLVGFSGCQGIGTYQHPIPKLIESAPVAEEKPKPKKKVVKIKTLTPLTPVVKVKPAKLSPVAKLEVKVKPKGEEVIIDPSERLKIPGTRELQAINVTPVAPVVPTAEKPVIDKPTRVIVYRKFKMDELTFGFDQYSLTEKGKKALALIAEELRRDNKWFVLRFDGHTDSTGSVNYNDRLSLKRAIATATALVLNNGFDPNRIFVKGFGESKPVASNDTPEGRSANRRVEILVLVKKEE
ncbi:OmpA family protein [Geothermobacter ehrlichii]|uniref:OmpA family protein n=1 Tax=Geothermobacter ehrlichii TaxID=213224 RepID=A0A5D3WMU6_9BACT|nr:OmpA family protein [Geothermobacter ehrlichii]TYP00333.1 OmpA family protein [Geothermobacter ehrlichii]